MTTYNLLKFSLTLHIVGITMTAGTMLISYVVHQKFWKTYFPDKQKAMTILGVTSKFAIVADIGMAILLLSGIAMMLLTGGVFMHTFWFQIKLGVILLLIVNGFLVIRRLTSRLNKILGTETMESNNENKIISVKRTLNASMVFQLFLFFVIFVLASFRFT